MLFRSPVGTGRGCTPVRKGGQSGGRRGQTPPQGTPALKEQQEGKEASKGSEKQRSSSSQKKTQKGNDGVDYFMQMALVNGVKCYRLNKLDKG